MPGLLRGVVRTAAVVGTASAVSGRVQRRQQQRWAQQDYQQSVPVQQMAPPEAVDQSAPTGPPDTLSQLTQLGELRAQGVLTEEEFAQAKAQVLGG
jgi:hypothetical protein